MDWYKAKEGRDFEAGRSRQSVSDIYNYYKTQLQDCCYGRSFRNIGEILELAGCDRLTIAPQLLADLEAAEGEVVEKLIDSNGTKERPAAMTHAEFLWDHNQDPMAVEASWRHPATSQLTKAN